MTMIFPNAARTKVVFTSSAEKTFYERTLELHGDWRIYYSRTLSTIEADEGLKDNEIDFVIYHPRFGIFVIEVKGGRIRFDVDKQEFFSINRHNEEFAIKNPFSQALVWKSRFVRLLRNKGIQVPVTHAVAFPSVDDAEFPNVPGIERTLIIGKSRLAHLNETLSSISRSAHPEKFLSFKDCAADIDLLLVGQSFQTKEKLKDYLRSNDKRLIDIESMQETLLPPILAKPRLAIEGEAGTGKTLLAGLIARRFAGQGKSILFLISNPAMKPRLREIIPESVEIKTYSELADAFGVNLIVPPADFSGSQNDWMQYEAPDRLKRAIVSSSPRYDGLVCDEAQDVQPFWWESIDALLLSKTESYLYIFFDRSQGVFGSGVVAAGSSGEYTPEHVLPVVGPYFPLVNNYRTTREIATFSRAFRRTGDTFQSYCGRIGFLPEVITYSDEADCVRKLNALSQSLIQKDSVRPDDITVVSFRNPKASESAIKDAASLGGFPIASPMELSKFSSTDREKTICVSTVAGFKGMETNIGILVNLSEYNMPLENPIMASLLYVAATRARHMLYIFVRKDDPKKKALEEAKRAISNSGMIVLEDSDELTEFVGTITHYNPDRVGWLAVDDQSSSQNSIMFFPSDVQKYGLKDIKVGRKLKFRPRVEGFATIAGDLREVNSNEPKDTKPQPLKESSS